MKKVLIIIGILVVLVGAGFFALTQLSGNPDDIAIENIDVSSVADGTYTGEHETTLVFAQVQVTVTNGQITDVEILRHDCGRGYGAEIIVDDIVDAQSLNVDTISGATMSSKVILKAVEVAMKQGE